jgi:formate/nitrite transporter FocA (FNT family)
VPKVYAVSFPVRAFGALGYQHLIANFARSSALTLAEMGRSDRIRVLILIEIFHGTKVWH